MNNALIIVIMFLVIIALLLTIGILAVCFWNLLIVLRQFMVYTHGLDISYDVKTHEKMEKERVHGGEEYSEKASQDYNKNSAIRKKTVYTSGIDDIAMDMRKEGEESVSYRRDTVDIINLNKENKKDLVEFIKRDSKIDCIRLDLKNKCVFKSWAGDDELTESLEGRLVIYEETRNGCIVVPADEIIGEREYAFSGVESCYRVNQEVVSGQNYRIVDVKKPCIVEKKENGDYIIKEKGELVIERKE